MVLGIEIIALYSLDKVPSIAQWLYKWIIERLEICIVFRGRKTANSQTFQVLAFLCDQIPLRRETICYLLLVSVTHTLQSPNFQHRNNFNIISQAT